MGDVVRIGVDEAVPDGWRPLFFADEFVRFVPPEGVPVAEGTKREMLIASYDDDATYSVHVPGRTIGLDFGSLRDACWFAEREYCGCHVRRDTLSP